MLLLEAGQATCNILLPYAIGRIIAAVMETPSGYDLDPLHGPLLWFAGLGLGEVLFSRASGAILVSIGPRMRRETAAQLYAYLQHHSHRYFSEHFAGALAHRITETATSLNHTMWTILFDFWPVAIVFGVSISLLVRVHTVLAGFVGGWALLFVLVSYGLARRCRPYAQGVAAVRSEVNGRIVDSVSNLNSVRLFARGEHERHLLQGHLDREVKTAQQAFWYMERVRWFQFISALILKLGTLYFALSLWQQGEIGVGDFAMTTSLALLIISDARNLSRRFLEFFEYVGNISNGVQTIIQSHEVIDRPNARPVTIVRGEIALDRIGFGYTPGVPVFRDLSVTIKAGQRVGLVGYSGSGKSTFVALIQRLYDVASGSVFIDGVDIRDLTLDSLHSQISLIPQDPSLFHRSLLDNIRFGCLDASDEEVVAAARRAHADEFIGKMRDGYASLVGERGVKLSGGQRQRIAIARVILKNAPILILDEATSSLDSVTEQAIQSSLETVMANKTVLVIAHRLSTIAHLDRILVFHEGRIIEDGSHAELLAMNGHYSRLWARQAGGFLPEKAA